MSAKEAVKSKNYELVPPDGGWGYAIWIAVIINMIATTAFMGSFGMIFNELYEKLEMGSTSITLLNGINALCVAISGFMAGPLLKFMSKRQLGLVAAFFLNLGASSLIFVNSRVVFFLCQLLQNLGVGLFYNLSMSIINEYFVKRRLLSISLTQTVPAIVSMFAPQLVKMTLNIYGFRGTLFLLLAVNVHTLVSVCLMQPVSWHYKKVEVLEETNVEMKVLIKSKDPVELAVKSNSKDIDDTKYSEKEVETDVELNVSNDKNNSIKKLILEAIDLSLIKSFLLSNAGLGMALCGFCDLTFTLILPQTLYSMNWTQDQVAWAISLSSFGDLVTRILFIFGSTWLLRFESQKIYLIGLVLAIATRIGMLGSENVTVILTFLLILGTSRCIILLLMPQVIADTVRPEQFTSAIGVSMLAFGCINVLLGPVIGAVRDLTNSYPTAIYITTSGFAIVLIFWIVEICYKKNKHKRKPKKQNLTTG
ncbi:monocarboxylate transporter 1-like [Battus philenor]|uniref:monocarboxylate transporter 1-like n=1 Tax=Battus philenor TaxID=42288 RepID=UPI0035D01BF6